jgi:hypothetical protein
LGGGGSVSGRAIFERVAGLCVREAAAKLKVSPSLVYRERARRFKNTPETEHHPTP